MNKLIERTCKPQIINSFDLNDYVEPGSYACDSNRVAKMMTNSPVDTSFHLHIERLQCSNESIQLLLQGCSGDIYYRVISSGVTPWRKVITENVLEHVIMEIRAELSDKAEKSELFEMEDKLQEILNNKSDISFVKEIESRLCDLILDKVSVESLTELESKLLGLLDLKADLDEIVKLENSLQKRFDEKADKSEVSALESKVSSLQIEAGSLESKVVSLEGKVGYLESNVNSLEGKVGSLESEVSSLEGKVSSLENEVASLEGKVNDATNVKLASLKSEIMNLINVKNSEQDALINNMESKLKNTFMLSGGVSIPMGANLDNYTTVGNYYCTLNGDATTLINRPKELTNAFMLKVIAGNGVNYPSQILYELATGKTFYRTYDSHLVKWWDWVKLNS